MSRSPVININGKKLERILEIAQTSPEEVSEDMNWNSGYLRRCIKNNQMSLCRAINVSDYLDIGKDWFEDDSTIYDNSLKEFYRGLIDLANNALRGLD